MAATFCCEKHFLQCVVWPWKVLKITVVSHFVNSTIFFQFGAVLRFKMSFGSTLQSPLRYRVKPAHCMLCYRRIHPWCAPSPYDDALPAICRFCVSSS